MTFILIIMTLIGYLIFGFLLAGVLLWAVDRWNRNAGMAYRDTWQEKVRHTVRRVMLY